MKEPKVLTAEEWLYDNAQPFSNPLRMQLIPTFEGGHKNGRLEMWLELKPLVGACLEIRKLYYPHVINDKESHAKAMNVLLHVTKNLKPLEEKK